jgi:hypothetical protein
MRTRKIAFAAKLAIISLCAFASCASKKAKAAEPAPCHNGGITQVRTAEKLVITTCTFVQPCTCDSQEIVFSELKGAPGARGPAGEPGARGGQGPAGGDEVISWCHHSEQDHINRTVRVKISDVVKQFGGYRGQADFPGSCGDTENKCLCDRCNIANPQVRHYFE